MTLPSSTTTTDAESTHRRADDDAESEADADVDGSVRPELLERIQDLEDRVDAQHDRIEELEATNESLRETVTQQAERIDDLEDDLDWTTDHLFQLEGTVIDDWTDSMLLDELGYSSLGDAVLDLTNTVSMDEVAALRDKQITDHQSVKHDLARIRRQLNHVSEETDVELLDAMPGDDKIAKAVQDGIATVVTGQVTATYDRAELVLQNLADWGTVRRDANGTFVYLTAPTVAEKLETARNESLQSTQVKRVLQTIVDLAADSPRYARLGKTDTGTWRLKLGVTAKRED